MLGLQSFPTGWEFLEVRRAGQLAGFFCFKGNEIHAYRHPEFSGKWLTRQDIERVAGPLIERFGCVVTSVRRDNHEGHRFVTRLGFQRTHEAGGLTHYRTERLNHARL